jgi:hypothetical protein
MNYKNYLLVFVFMLLLNCSLNAQETSTDNPSEPKAELVDVLDDAGEEVDKGLESPDTANDDEADDAEVDGDEAEDDEAEERENTPISIRVNQDGKLVGQAQALVSGNWLPVEATIALVSDDILLNKIVAEEDGSFSFPDIVPGTYQVYGTAASFCGRRAVTVLSESGCCDCVDLGLRQDSAGACYSELPSAPAATFSEGTGFSGGFANGSGFVSGGPFAGGGGGFVASGGSGVASGISRLRLLAVGGIVTAIAVSDDDDVATPSE